MSDQDSPREVAAGIITMVNSEEWLERHSQTAEHKAGAEEKATLAAIVWRAIGVLNVHPYGWLRDFALTRFLGSSYAPRHTFALISTSPPLEMVEFDDIADYHEVEREIFLNIKGMRLDTSRIRRSQDADRLPQWYEVSQALSRLALTDSDISLLGAEGAARTLQEFRRAPEEELDSEFLDPADDADVSMEPHEMRTTAAAAVRRIVSDEWWRGCGGTLGNAAHARYKARMSRLIWRALGVGDIDQFPWLDGPALSRYLGASMVNHDLHLVGSGFAAHARMQDIHNALDVRGNVMQGFPGATLDQRRLGSLGWPPIAQALMRVRLLPEDVLALGLDGKLR
ncbi:MAG: hypothetical protein OXT70_12845 [Chloroflexota bacterium]|nr:hypothetical protein [Chloroflexota bacterium]